MVGEGPLKNNLEKLFDRFSDSADDVLRLAYTMVLDRDKAMQVVSKTFDRVVDHLEASSPDVCLRTLVLSECWDVLKQGFLTDAPKGDGGRLSTALIELETGERLSVVCVDVIGLTASQTCLVTTWENDELRDYLASGRQKLVDLDLV